MKKSNEVEFPIMSKLSFRKYCSYNGHIMEDWRSKNGNTDTCNELSGYQMNRELSKNWDSQNSCHYCAELEQKWIYNVEILPTCADGIADNVDPDQTAPIRAV